MTGSNYEETSYSFEGGERSPFEGVASSFFLNNNFIFLFVICANRYKKSNGNTMASVTNLMSRTTTNLQNSGMASNNVRFRPPLVESSRSDGGGGVSNEDLSCSSVDVICTGAHRVLDKSRW